MPKRIAMSALNASTVDILNTIRANASSAYQNQVPEITKATEIPVVGDVLFGYPALANEFISALVNRIALVRVNSVTFNNEYAELKKGFIIPIFLPLVILYDLDSSILKKVWESLSQKHIFDE